MFKKRERTQNWTPEEKRYLLELCEKRLDVLENKKIDSASSSLKGLTWNHIHEKFGERFGLERDVQRLREQWRRMKGHAKNEMLVESAQMGSEKRGAASGSLSDAIRRSLGVPQGRVRCPQHLPASSSSGVASASGSGEPSTSGSVPNPRLSGEPLLNGLLRNGLHNGTTTCKMDSMVMHGEIRDTKNFLHNLRGKGSESNTSMSDDDENGLVIDIDIKEEIIEPIIDIDEREFQFVPRMAHGDRKPLVSILTVEHAGDSGETEPVTGGAVVGQAQAASVRHRTPGPPPTRTSEDMFALEMFKMRVLEQNRRMEMMETEHKLRMEALELKRDTKRIKREMLIAENIENAHRVNAGRNEPCAVSSVRFGSDQLGSMGSGAGKGGGGGGSIREAGGAFGKMEAAREEEFFYKQQREQLLKLKTDLTDEISFHEEQVKRHQEAIKRHTQRVSDIENKTH